MSLSAHVMFCGLGGSTEGMLAAGLDVRGAIDAWSVAIEAHRRWHPSIPAVVGRCEDACELLPEPVDLVWASPSCRPWSTANRTATRGIVHPEYYPLALLVEQAFDQWGARWLIIENVGGLVWSREGREEMGRLADAVRARPALTWTTTIVRACDHGVRQLRRRPIIVVGPALCPILEGSPGVAEQAVTCAMDGGNHPGPSAARELARSVGARESRPWSQQEAGRAHRSFRAEPSVRAVRGGGRDSDAYAKRRHCASRGTAHDPRTGEVTHRESRTLAECAELQCLPMAPLEGLTSTAAHRLVGNAVPPPHGRVGLPLRARGRRAPRRSRGC